MAIRLRYQAIVPLTSFDKNPIFKPMILKENVVTGI